MKSHREAHIAEDLAQGVPGVISVANELSVEHPMPPGHDLTTTSPR
jgi:hypothetical protein